jgi:type I restriction enzyme S subunit
MKRAVIRRTARCVTERAIETNTKLKVLDPPAVLIVVRSAILAHTLPIALSEVPLAISQDIRALRPKPHAKFDVWYLFAALMGSRSLFLSQAHGTSHGSRALSSQELLRWEIPIPPFDIMQQIGEAMRLYVALNESSRQARAHIEEMGSQVMEAAFSHDPVEQASETANSELPFNEDDEDDFGDEG